MKNTLHLSTPAQPESFHDLTDENKLQQISELDHSVIRAYNKFSHWSLHCMKATGQNDLTPLDILIIYNINYRAHEKRLSDIAFILDIDDLHTINYSLKKLVKKSLISGQKQGKEIFYSTTTTGKEVCETYNQVRHNFLIQPVINSYEDYLNIKELAQQLQNLANIYDQASRATISF